MKLNKFIKFILAIGGAVSLSGCEKNKEPEVPVEEEEVLNPVAINSLYDGMVAMYQTKNYTFKIIRKEGSSAAKSYTLKFKQDFVGYDGYKMSDFKGAINDGSGIFNVSYEDDYIISEYLRNSEGAIATSLWDNSVVHTMYGIGGQYIKKNITSNITSITITDKNYIIGFMETFGYDSTVFGSVNSLKASYEEGTVSFAFSLALSTKVYYTIKLADVGTTTSEHLKEFKASGKKVFTPHQDLSEMRRLLKLDNFAHKIYTIYEGEGSYTGYEFFTPYYFITTSLQNTNVGNGYMELDHKADESNINQDMYGIYMFSVSVVDKEYNFDFSSIVYNTTPEIEKCLHYPSFLKLLTNLEYVKEGNLRDSDYVYDSSSVKRYYFTEQFLVNDFANNFSIYQNFEDCTALGVSIELDLEHENDADKNIVFHCIVQHTVDGTIYDIVLPLLWFGAANKTHWYATYEVLNNRTASAE